MREVPKKEQIASRPKRASRRLRIVPIVLLGLLFWAIPNAWAQMGKFDEKSAQIEQLSAKLDETKKINDEMKREVARLNDPEYREEKMRKQGYAKSGETVFDIPKAAR